MRHTLGSSQCTPHTAGRHKKSGELTEKGLPNITCFRHRLHASHIAVDLLQRLSGVGHREVSVHDKPQPTGSLVVMEAVLACLKGQEAVLPAVRQAAKDNRHRFTHTPCSLCLHTYAQIVGMHFKRASSFSCCHYKARQVADTRPAETSC